MLIGRWREDATQNDIRPGPTCCDWQGHPWQSRCRLAVIKLMVVLQQLHFGFGGGLGFGTPVVSYAPLPMLQTTEDFGVSIMFLARCTEGQNMLETVKAYIDGSGESRLFMTQADSQLSKSSYQ